MNWKQIFKRCWVSTGGGFDYWVTIWRHTNNFQIELIENTEGNECGIVQYNVNIGYVPEYVRAGEDLTNPEWIQGDYLHTTSFPTVKESNDYIRNFMKEYGEC